MNLFQLMKTKTMRTSHPSSLEEKEHLQSNGTIQMKVLDQKNTFLRRKESLIYRTTMEMKVLTTLI